MSGMHSDHAFCSVDQRYCLIRAAIFGHVMGDALGAPVEFVLRQKLQDCPVNDMAGGGMRGYAAGTWSDDSSMTLCALESLILCKGFDGADMMGWFARWQTMGIWRLPDTPLALAGQLMKRYAAFGMMKVCRCMAGRARRIMAMVR